MPLILITRCVQGCVRQRRKMYSRDGALIRRAEQVFYRAVGVFFGELFLLGVGMGTVLGVAVAMQAEQERIRHHHPAEEQEQKQRDIVDQSVHVNRMLVCKSKA